MLVFTAGCATTTTTNNQSANKPFELNFETSDSEIIQAGNQAAGQQDWDTAVKDWKEGAASEEPVDQAAAQYNLGLYAETKGRLPEALANYQTAKKLGDTEKFDGDIARVQGLIDEEQAKNNAPATEAAPEPKAAEPAAAGQDESETWKTNPGLKVVREKGMHRFNWEPVANATGYNVYTAKAKGKPFKQLNHKVLAKPQLRAKALPRGKVLVQVAAIGPDGNEIARSKPVRMAMP
jgi:pyruvate/2-oxoglutarate dehydrogenase complex dihydrolipoamide acyltransferase (E2) component